MMQVPYGELPGASRLFADYTANESRIRAFYPNGFDFDSILNFARKRRAAELPHRDALCRILVEQQRSRSGNTDSVQRLANGAVAVVTGQQPGLFTGPLYAILKAI